MKGYMKKQILKRFIFFDAGGRVLSRVVVSKSSICDRMIARTDEPWRYDGGDEITWRTSYHMRQSVDQEVQAHFGLVYVRHMQGHVKRFDKSFGWRDLETFQPRA